MKRHTSEPHRVSKSQPTVANALVDYLMFQCGVKVQAWMDEGKNLRIKCDDYADWIIARKMAREQFGFDKDCVVREICP